jgi:hypothetical protein
MEVFPAISDFSRNELRRTLPKMNDEKMILMFLQKKRLK